MKTVVLTVLLQRDEQKEVSVNVSGIDGDGVPIKLPDEASDAIAREVLGYLRDPLDL